MRMEFIEPGLFRTELHLEAVTSASDATGGQVVTWSEIATLFARVEPVSAASLMAAGQRHERVTHRITMRHRDDITSAMRLTRGERVFTVRTVRDPDETGRYLVCMAEEAGR